MDKSIRLLLSIVFLLSAMGKLIQPSIAASALENLFHLPNFGGVFVVGLWSIAELVLSIMIWRKHISCIFLTVPIIIIGTFILFYLRDTDCGCFGAIPQLIHLSFFQHTILLVGILFSILYLTPYPRLLVSIMKDKNKLDKAKITIGMVALFTMVTFSISIPFNKSNESMLNFIEISKKEVKKLINSNANILIVDARPKFQYLMGHIPGAINISYNADIPIDLMEKYQMENKRLIVYCSSRNCKSAEILANRLINMGYEKLLIYPGGWREWNSEPPL